MDPAIGHANSKLWGSARERNDYYERSGGLDGKRGEVIPILGCRRIRGADLEDRPVRVAIDPHLKGGSVSRPPQNVIGNPSVPRSVAKQDDRSHHNQSANPNEGASAMVPPVLFTI